MVRSKKLKDFVGRNEKTKIVAKLQKKNQGAPSREPVFSEEQQKEMMAYAYRKQEEMKVCWYTVGRGGWGWRPRAFWVFISFDLVELVILSGGL